MNKDFPSHLTILGVGCIGVASMLIVLFYFLSIAKYDILSFLPIAPFILFMLGSLCILQDYGLINFSKKKETEI